MDTKTKKTLAKYILDLQKKLCLQDWVLFLQDTPPDDEDVWATVDPIEGRKHARIYLCNHFLDLKPEQQRSTIVHELIHLHHIPATEIIRLDLWESRCMSNDTYNVLFGAFKRQMEYCVDGITDAIASMFPLIDWGKQSK